MVNNNTLSVTYFEHIVSFPFISTHRSSICAAVLQQAGTFKNPPNALSFHLTGPRTVHPTTQQRPPTEWDRRTPPADRDNRRRRRSRLLPASRRSRPVAGGRRRRSPVDVRSRVRRRASRTRSAWWDGHGRTGTCRGQRAAGRRREHRPASSRRRPGRHASWHARSRPTGHERNRYRPI